MTAIYNDYKVKFDMKKFKKSLAKIIKYLYKDEKRHYEECSEADKKNHIFKDIQVVRKWL